MVNAAELNDCPAELQAWNEDKGRYGCRVSKTDGTVAKTFIKPENLLLPSGTSVCVVGTSQAELNGSAGVTSSFNAEKGRYAVKVEGRAKPAGLKPENIRVVLPEAAAKQAARPEFGGLTQDEEG